MKEETTITIRDVDSSEEAVAIVRYDNNRVALCLSLQSNGDVEVVMNKVDAEILVEVLKKAINHA